MSSAVHDINLSRSEETSSEASSNLNQTSELEKDIVSLVEDLKEYFLNYDDERLLDGIAVDLIIRELKPFYPQADALDFLWAF